MASYPYAPPPPPPTASAPPPGQYPSYNQPHSYSAGSHRGGQSSYGGGGRGRGGHHDYNSNSRYYPKQPDYAPPPPGGPYTAPQASAPWQSAPTVNHYPPHQQSVPHHATPAYPAGYNPQAYNTSVGPGYQAQYPATSARPSHGPPYPYPSDQAQRWPDQGAYTSYSTRGGRGGFQSDRGGHKSDNSMMPPNTMRMGFDHGSDRAAHSASPYGPPYQPSPVPGPYGQPPYSYPPAPETPYSASPHAPHNAHGYNSRGGSGRDGFGHSNRGGRGGHGGRGEKFRHHRDQKPSHGFNPSQKPDAAVHSKKKKRKTNTLGLTPGDDSSEGEGAQDDEEKRLSDMLGADAPVIPDLAAWLAERKANYPTKARIEAKKAAAATAAAASSESKTDEASKPGSTQIDKDQAKIEKLERKLSKLKGSIEKRKRAANDEGDEMRADESAGSSDSSDDEAPEVQTTSKPSNTFLPPPPITRADPSNHCKYYSTGGTCGKKGKCRFKHDPAVREAALQERTRNGGHMTLKQRLLLNDKDHEDMDVVKAILEMRASGRLVDPQSLQVRAKNVTEEQAPTVTAPSTLPTAGGVASLPPNPFAASKKPSPQKKPDQAE
ncbi:hypothetical protein NPX13_g7462 [Xylaria arbuscula]|uniref:C3H1-type domain-containing protein n=1 Tax=Xylaria arbuscula TaxID=114810 RepID=A0A9W8NAK0_9PEZI|nr:hypothetical protein NPX13_g7462 [Xylaria arbuscula]